MKPDFRKTMIWLHTYSGLLGGWLLFTIWISGTLTYYNQEISQWMRPELGLQASAPKLINTSLQYLAKEGVNAKQWDVNLPYQRSNQLKVTWKDSLDRRAKRYSTTIHNNDLTSISPRETKGGEFFRQFHYTVHLRQYGSRYVTGMAAMFMLVTLFSGIFTHRRFFRDFFTLRFRNLLKAITDLHAVTGVITIPFCFLISLSALSVYTDKFVPWSMEYHFDGGRQGIDKHITTKLSPIEPTQVAVKPIDNFDHISAQIAKIWPEENAINSLRYQYPYDQNGRIIVSRNEQFSLSRKKEQLVFAPHSGEIIETTQPEGFARTVRRVLYGMHEANFASPTLRFFLFFMGVSSTFLIGSGLVIWLNKRLEKIKKRHLGHTIVEKLNISVIMGLLIAIASYFYANRLFDVNTPDRINLEVNTFFISWLVVCLFVMCRPITTAWKNLLLIAGIGYLFLPVLDLIINHQWLIQSLINKRFIYVCIELAMITAGVICILFYQRIKKKAIKC